MTQVQFCKLNEIPEELLRYVVILARYDNRWVMCKHKCRATWEIPGGHIEKGETAAEAALRELKEETGAVDAELVPVTVYCVTKSDTVSYGMVFWAVIREISALAPKSEIGEIGLFDRLPSDLTYPDIQPLLYDHVQGWLNLQSNADELWDVYNKDRELTGRVHRRGNPPEDGDYHLVVHIWLRNSKGEYLLTKRAPNKGFPLMWETTGGSALAGDSSLDAALREVKEETGLTIDPQKGCIIYRYTGADYHEDVWLFEQEHSLEDVVLQEGETCDKMYASLEKIRKLKRDGLLVPYKYVDSLLDILEDNYGKAISFGHGLQ